MDSLLEKFESLQAVLMQFPVLVYVFLGTIIEEVVSPIPSPIILASAGFIIDSQEKGVLFLFLAAFVGMVGKMLGTMLYYFAGLKGEEFLDKKIVRVLGLSSLDVDKYGNFFEDSKKGMFLFLMLRILPIFPSSPVSLVAGMIKVEMRKFVVLSSIGIFFRNLLLLAFGYFSYENMDYVLEIITDLENKLGEALILFVIVAFALYAYKNKSRLEDIVMSRFRKN
jgi:membrane protein DedA with SNARE-associated domain